MTLAREQGRPDQEAEQGECGSSAISANAMSHAMAGTSFAAKQQFVCIRIGTDVADALSRERSA
jgi:hypothetical protein